MAVLGCRLCAQVVTTRGSPCSSLEHLGPLAMEFLCFALMFLEVEVDVGGSNINSTAIDA